MIYFVVSRFRVTIKVRVRKPRKKTFLLLKYKSTKAKKKYFLVLRFVKKESYLNIGESSFKLKQIRRIEKKWNDFCKKMKKFLQKKSFGRKMSTQLQFVLTGNFK